MSEETPQDASLYSTFDLIRPGQNNLTIALLKAIQNKNFLNIGILIFLGAPVNDEIKEFAQREGVFQHVEAALNAAYDQNMPSSRRLSF